MTTALSTPAVELFPRVRALVSERHPEYAEHTMRVPMANYRDPQILTAEMEHIFGASPLALAPSGAIGPNGEYITRALPDGRSVIISRGDDGVARVLLNACRHRGAQVADESGCARRFTCPYHGWSYDPSGALVGQPGRPGFDDLEPAQLGLVELPSEEAFGFVWTTPEGSSTVAEYLGEFGNQLARYDYGSCLANPPMEVELAANWKCLVEAFFETYHFTFVHQNSMVGQGTIANIVSFDAFGRNARLGVPLVTMRDLPAEDAGLDFEHVSVLYFVYPNLVIANSPLGCELIEARPADTPDRAVLRHIFLAKADPALMGFGATEDYLASIRAIVRDQDGPVISSSGRGIRDAAHDFVVLGRNEPGCQHIHRQYVTTLQEAGCPVELAVTG